jgi:hypothetical protein
MKKEIFVKKIGPGEVDTLFDENNPLHGFSQVFDSSLKPANFYDALDILNFAAVVDDEGEWKQIFTIEPFHPRYGLPDDYFFLQNSDLWAVVKNPLQEGDFLCYDKLVRVWK